jgi:hypothetical protein
MILDEVLDRLYDSEINSASPASFDNGIDVKLGDEMNGFRAEANVATASEAAAWLDVEARRVFPRSKYAAGKDVIGSQGNGGG